MSQVRDFVLLAYEEDEEEEEEEAVLLNLPVMCIIISSLSAVGAGLTVVVRDIGFESKLMAYSLSVGGFVN